MVFLNPPIGHCPQRSRHQTKSIFHSLKRKYFAVHFDNTFDFITSAKTRRQIFCLGDPGGRIKAYSTTRMTSVNSGPSPRFLLWLSPPSAPAANTIYSLAEPCVPMCHFADPGLLEDLEDLEICWPSLEKGFQRYCNRHRSLIGPKNMLDNSFGSRFCFEKKTHRNLEFLYVNVRHLSRLIGFHFSLLPAHHVRFQEIGNYRRLKGWVFGEFQPRWL